MWGKAKAIVKPITAPIKRTIHKLGKSHAEKTSPLNQENLNKLQSELAPVTADQALASLVPKKPSSKHSTASLASNVKAEELPVATSSSPLNISSTVLRRGQTAAEKQVEEAVANILENPTLSQDLKDNMQLAHSVYGEVKAKKFQSDTYTDHQTFLKREYDDTLPEGDTVTMNSRLLKSCMNMLRDAQNFAMEDLSNAQYQDIIKARHQATQDFHNSMQRVLEGHTLGNCGEQADAALVKVGEKNPDIKVEKVVMKFGNKPGQDVLGNRRFYDHAFVRIGEGKNAVILDPWSNTVLPEEAGIKQIKNLLKLDDNTMDITITPEKTLLKEIFNY